jgi:hypothetical protein
MITKFCTYSANAALLACTHQSAPAIHTLSSAHQVDVRARLVSAPSHPRPHSATVRALCVAHARTRMLPELILLAPIALAWITTSDCPSPYRLATIKKIIAIKLIWNSNFFFCRSPPGSYQV